MMLGPHSPEGSFPLTVARLFPGAVDSDGAMVEPKSAPKHNTVLRARCPENTVWTTGCDS